MPMLHNSSTCAAADSNGGVLVGMCACGAVRVLVQEWVTGGFVGWWWAWEPVKRNQLKDNSTDVWMLASGGPGFTCGQKLQWMRPQP
jgi:hypothetical protein